MCSLFLVSSCSVCVSRQETVFKKNHATALDYVGSPCSWDNAPTESFFNSLKNERVHGAAYATRADAQADLFEYIEVFYNRSRRHSTLGYSSPVRFLEEWISQHSDQQSKAA